ncbi:MAG: triose-phosphate isomerase [Deltaproteobacteria bacterium]|nr:triose-phosphate isomerase [Deltaproteobacteria bacterium]
MPKKRKCLIAGNFKMYLLSEEIKRLARAISDFTVSKKYDDREVMIAPPFPYLFTAASNVNPSFVYIGSQNLYFEKEGAYTGEVSPLMVKDCGASFAIIGHSERRKYFFETEEVLRKKILSAMSAGLIPVYCVGEKIEDRNNNRHFEVVKRQIEEALNDVTFRADNLVIAYEPVWAIGTGVNATPEQAEEMHLFIRKLIAEIRDKGVSENIRILYGGSVKPENIDSLMKMENIDGALVGGASLKAEQFTRIIDYRI